MDELIRELCIARNGEITVRPHWHTVITKNAEGQDIESQEMRSVDISCRWRPDHLPVVLGEHYDELTNCIPTEQFQQVIGDNPVSSSFIDRMVSVIKSHDPIQ